MWILNHDPESGNILKNDFNGKLSHMQKLTSGIKEAPLLPDESSPHSGPGWLGTCPHPSPSSLTRHS